MLPLRGKASRRRWKVCSKSEGGELLGLRGSRWCAICVYCAFVCLGGSDDVMVFTGEDTVVSCTLARFPILFPHLLFVCVFEVSLHDELIRVVVMTALPDNSAVAGKYQDSECAMVMMEAGFDDFTRRQAADGGHHGWCTFQQSPR